MGNKKLNKKYTLSCNKHLNLKPTCEPHKLFDVYTLGCVKNVNTMFVDEGAWEKNIHCHRINNEI
jgi:hypothetical protein